VTAQSLEGPSTCSMPCTDSEGSKVQLTVSDCCCPYACTIPYVSICAGSKLDHLAVSVSSERQSISACSARTDRLAQTCQQDHCTRRARRTECYDQASPFSLQTPGYSDQSSLNCAASTDDVNLGIGLRECEHVGSGQSQQVNSGVKAVLCDSCSLLTSRSRFPLHSPSLPRDGIHSCRWLWGTFSTAPARPSWGIPERTSWLSTNCNTRYIFLSLLRQCCVLAELFPL
jgi:hypothetical protein